jgi:hypothetical protein
MSDERRGLGPQGRRLAPVAAESIGEAPPAAASVWRDPGEGAVPLDRIPAQREPTNRDGSPIGRVRSPVRRGVIALVAAGAVALAVSEFHSLRGPSGSPPRQTTDVASQRPPRQVTQRPSRSHSTGDKTVISRGHGSAGSAPQRPAAAADAADGEPQADDGSAPIVSPSVALVPTPRSTENFGFER